MQGSAYARITAVFRVSTIGDKGHSRTAIMAEAKASATSDGRPKAIHTSNSFSRMDPPPAPISPRKRASTMQEKGITAVPEARHISVSPEISGKKHVADVFENPDEDETAPSGTGTPGPEIQVPSTFDELPIEIKSLTERFLESLSAKVHPTPLSADALSSLFQDFYERAASHIATHIASLSSRIGRGKSPAPSTSSRGSVMGRSRAGSGAKRTESSPNASGGEMLTASEVAGRRKARRLLELKRLALEEAVERAVCEKVYDGIYKHKSSDDDERDEKLRSRTAALALVGIGLKELHVDTPSNEGVRKAAEEKEEDIHQSLAAAREALQMMDDEHYPLGKLQHLIAAHKSIVETLSQLFPATSSADEILPTLIYTLITSPPEGINVVSNLNFIQRFRTSNKVDGEAAYCLVNLEAAISFLETVALPSLRAEELPEGPPKGESGHITPALEEQTQDATAFLAKPPAAQALKPGVSTVSAVSADTSSSPTEAVKALPSPRTPPKANQTTVQQRRISALVQAQADRIEAGRENILNTADKIYESINGTLENSFQFVFGRFKDRTADDSPLPKTLEDARKLVSSPNPNEEDDSQSHSGRSSPALDDPLNAPGKSDGKMLEIIGGRKQLRDRSVDSARSTGSSSRRVLFNTEQAKPKDDPPTPSGNLFATINPLNRFSVPSFPRFGRAGSLPNTPNQPSPGTEKPLSKLGDIVESPVSTRDAELPPLEKTRSGESNDDDLNAREALAELRKLKPPSSRFLQVRNAGELKISEVEELLADYRRLAKAIGEAIAT